jgi:hypothetical protein
MLPRKSSRNKRLFSWNGTQGNLPLNNQKPDYNPKTHIFKEQLKNRFLDPGSQGTGYLFTDHLFIENTRTTFYIL